MRKPRLLAAVTILTSAAISGCGLFGSRGPAPIDVVLSASSRLNLDEQGQSLPTVVRFYQLRSQTKLQNAEYGPVYSQPKETLGEDLLMVEEVTIMPGQTLRRRFDRDAGAKAVAAVGLFRRPSGDSWRAIADLPPGGKAEFAFTADGSRLERR